MRESTGPAAAVIAIGGVYPGNEVREGSGVSMINDSYLLNA